MGDKLFQACAALTWEIRKLAFELNFGTTKVLVV